MTNPGRSENVLAHREAKSRAGDPPKIYSDQYYERIRALEDRHWWYVGMREISAALLGSEPTMDTRPRVLDAGCGTGAAMTWARAAAAAGSVTGIDVSAYALAFCRGRGERALCQSSVIELPFRDAVFDLVLCNDVLQHLPIDGGDVAALKEMHRVLRPGGLLLIRTNSRRGVLSGVAEADSDFQRYRLDAVVQRMQSAGFVVSQASYVNALPSLYASLKARLYRPRAPAHAHHHTAAYQGLGIREGAMNRRWLNRLLTWVLGLEARYLSRGNRRLGFGHTIVSLGLKPR